MSVARAFYVVRNTLFPIKYLGVLSILFNFADSKTYSTKHGNNSCKQGQQADADDKECKGKETGLAGKHKNGNGGNGKRAFEKPTRDEHSWLSHMIELNLNHINLRSPYTVWRQGEQLFFKTDNLIIYNVSFDYEEVLAKYSGYWLNLSNTSGLKSPNDVKISLTLAAIVEEFFTSQPHVMLYLCDSVNHQQAQRARLFLHWFTKLNSDNRFVIHTAIVKDEEEEDYVALIVERNNPQREKVLSFFSNEIKLFNENK